MKATANAPFAFRLPDPARERLEAEAARLGVKAGELARAWILDRLAGPPLSADQLRAELARLGAVVLAGLSADLGLDEAGAVLAEHYLGRKPGGGA